MPALSNARHERIGGNLMDAKQFQSAFCVEYLKGVADRLATMTFQEREAFMRWFNARPR